MCKKRQCKAKVFGRVNMVLIGIELFYLRSLLIHVEAPTLFDDLFCFQNTVHPTYKVSCFVRGLLQNNIEWNNYLQEATVVALPRQIRRLFECFLCLDNHWILLAYSGDILTLYLMIGAMIKTAIAKTFCPLMNICHL